MKKIIVAAVLTAILVGCKTATNDTCAVVAKAAANPTAAAYLNALPPTSAGGILWADLQVGCANGASPAWLALVLAELWTLHPELFGPLMQ